MKYKVESGHPIPPDGRRVLKYPFRRLEVGQSFAFKDEDLASVRSIVNRWNRKTDREFAVRHDGKTYRVWRTV